MTSVEVSYDLEILALMLRALDEAWDKVQAMTVAGLAVDRDSIRNIMAIGIVTAPALGARWRHTRWSPDSVA
jgi:hypothetical protein